MAAGADHHRDVAAQFRSLAAIKPSDSLRQYLQRIAQRHDELAAGFEHRDPAVTRGILTWASGTRLWPSGWMRPAENNSTRCTRHWIRRTYSRSAGPIRSMTPSAYSRCI